MKTLINDKKIRDGSNKSNYFKFIICSLIGIILFFVPLTINGSNSIIVDHIVSFIRNTFPTVATYYCFIVIVVGAVLPFVDKSWNRNGVNIVLSLLKVVGVVFAAFYLFNMGPEILHAPNMLPFLYTKVIIPGGLVVPIGAMLLVFIIDYGLLEFLGVLMKPIMRPIWKVPGSASVAAVTSFVGSFSVGIFMTNKLFKEGKYTRKESAIIVTGFSTVSATFMVIVARTLDIMNIWTLFFMSALVVTFLTTAVSLRLWPLNKIGEDYYNDKNNSDLEDSDGTNILIRATNEALKAVNDSRKLLPSILENLKEGFMIICRLLPSMMSIGLIALVLASHTPVFDYIGMAFYPVTALLQLPDAQLVAKVSALAGAEMFVPNIIIAGTQAALISKFVVGIVSISSVLFFAGSIPVILATDLDLSIGKIAVIMIERIYISIILASVIGMLFL